MRNAVFIIFISSLALSAQRAKTAVEGTTPASLPNTTDVMPSRQVSGRSTPNRPRNGAMRPKFCAPKAGTPKRKGCNTKLLEEREHSLGLNSPDLVADLNDLGRVNFAQMKYGAAITYYERALQIMETSKGKQDFGVVGPLDKLARVYQMLEKYPQAEQYLRRALGIVEQTKGPSASEAGPELVALGDLLNLEKQFPEARSQYDRAVKIFEKSGIATPELLPALDGIAAVDVELHWACGGSRSCVAARAVYSRKRFRAVDA